MSEESHGNEYDNRDEHHHDDILAETLTPVVTHDPKIMPKPTIESSGPGHEP